MARVESLSSLVHGVFAVFSNNDYSVNRQSRPTPSKCLSDAWKNRDLVLLRPGPRQISRWKLVDVERDQIDGWFPPFAAPAVPEEEAIDKVLGVGVGEIHSPEQGDFFSCS